MGFVPYGGGAPVTLGVVAYGITEHLAACIESLVTHQSDTDFQIVCVVNPKERDVDPDVSSIPQGIHTIIPEANLGWAGGLHVARQACTSDWIGWIQDDSALLPGCLDAQLAVLRTDPRIGAAGVVALGPDGRAAGYSGGYLTPGVGVYTWNDSDPTAHGELPDAPVERDWVTSKGLLVRAEAWDDVGGPCARQYPLNHVDKEFSLHLRAHGWKLVVVPDANLTHLQSQSAPGLFRTFVAQWHDPAFDRRWGDVVTRLATSGGAAVEHDCHGHPTIESVERECLIEATRMVVPLGKFAKASVEAERAAVTAWVASHWERQVGELVAAQALVEADIHARAAAQAQAAQEAFTHVEAYALDLAAALAESEKHNIALVAANTQALAAADASALERDVMRASRSWRLTAPLRRVGSIARRIFGTQAH